MGAGLSLVDRVVLARCMLLGLVRSDRWTLRDRTCHGYCSCRTLATGNSSRRLPVGRVPGREKPCIGLFALSALLLGFTPTGCVSTESQGSHAQVPFVMRTAVVAPMLNLSANAQVDSLKLTDLFCSELAATQRFSVIPTNLVIAGLAHNGKTWVESPAEALQLAESFDADGTFVLALTEYDPYDPPVAGFILQWYPRQRQQHARHAMTGMQGAVGTAHPAAQVQRVFNAAAAPVQDELRTYAEDRSDKRSALKWRKYAQSQELYLRYCSWSLIQSMERVLLVPGTEAMRHPGTADEQGSSLSESDQGSASFRVSMPRGHGSRTAAAGDRSDRGA